MAQCQENGVRTVTLAEEGQLNLLREYHQKGHKTITRALTRDEAGDRSEAIRLYSKGLEYLAKGIDLRFSNEHVDRVYVESMKQMHSQMRKTARQMKTRLEELEREAPQRAEATSPKPQQQNGGVLSDITMQELEENLRLEEEMMNIDQPPSYDQTQANATEVFSVPEGVQIFFINPEGHVSAPSQPGPLRIYKFKDSELVDVANQPPAFLQVDDWLYPLVPGESPALRSREGAFIFPDVISGVPGACVGVMFDPNIDRAKTQAFEQTIRELTALREQRTPPPRPPPPRYRSVDGQEIPEQEEEIETEKDQLSTKIAKGIVIGAEWITWGVGKGAEATSYLIYKGKEKLKQNLRTEEEPTKVDPRLQTGAEYAQKASVVAVKVSRAVVDSLCYLTKRLGEEASPYIKRQSDKLLKGKDEPDSKMSKTIDGVVEVAASGLQGFGTIYNGLETAAKALAKNLANATTDVVHHKYGEDAARLTDKSLGAATNFGLTAYNMNSLGVKTIAKRAAKDTGKAVLKTYKEESLSKKETACKKTTEPEKEDK